MIHELRHMIGSADTMASTPDGRWVMAVPSPFYGGLFDRLRDGWAVICGRAYAVRWPCDGDLEAAVWPYSKPRPVRRPTTISGGSEWRA